MSAWDRKLNLEFRGWKWLSVALGTMALAWVIFLGTSARQNPSRCGGAFEPHDARCCAPGQGYAAGECVGVPEHCPAPFILIRDPQPGCVFPAERIQLSGGSVTIGPTDWDSVDIVEKRTVAVRPFLIDRIEVTHHRYQQCVVAGQCSQTGNTTEPGRPVTNLDAPSAEAFCRFSNGRLPTPAEWVFAAAGAQGRRYPWGPHGLVCRRAAFGLVSGPCGHDGHYPELSGLRQDGASSDGILDLAGNVAEWTLTEDGVAGVHGGSFRSKNASELKVWSTERARKSEWVGFRCVYPVE